MNTPVGREALCTELWKALLSIQWWSSLCQPRNHWSTGRSHQRPRAIFRDPDGGRVMGRSGCSKFLPAQSHWVISPWDRKWVCAFLHCVGWQHILRMSTHLARFAHPNDDAYLIALKEAQWRLLVQFQLMHYVGKAENFFLPLCSGDSNPGLQACWQTL